MKSMLSCFANTQRRESKDMFSKNDREYIEKRGNERVFRKHIFGLSSLCTGKIL